jgi:putative ABC transport system permease protein
VTVLRIAARNLNRQKKRSFLLGGAIAFGVLVITLVNGFAGGFVANIRGNVSHLFAGHLFVQGYEKSASGRLVALVRDDRALQRILAAAELPAVSTTRRSELDAALIFAGESVRQQVVGVDWETADFLRNRLVLRAGSVEELLAQRNAVVLNENVAAQLDVAVGDTLLVQSQTATGQQNVGEFLLAATTVDAGLFSGITAYAHRSYVNELLDIAPDAYLTLGVLLEDMDAVDTEGDRLYAALEKELDMVPRFAGQEGFREVRRELLQAEWEGTRYQLSTINDFLAGINDVARTVVITGVVVALILFLIVAVGITNTFRMVVYERTREIGTMRALGLQRRQARRLFLVEAVLLSLGGAGGGLLLAAIARAILQAIDLGNDSPLFIFLNDGHLSFQVDPLFLVGYLVAVVAVTLIAALFPANRAARQDPARALRSVA